MHTVSDIARQMSPIKLSAVIITYNEEANIGRCIDSLLPVVDEFIILDSFSKDRTIEIIREKSLPIHQRAWAGYSDTKNYANTLVTGDFILSIDADEELSPELQNSIANFKRNPDVDLCELSRLTNYCGKWIRHSGWYPEFKYRIFKRGLTQWKGTIHEELIYPANSSKKKLSGNLNHYSYPTVESHIRKMFVYATLAAEKDLLAGKRYTLLLHGLAKPAFMFVKKYFLQLGLLDGFYGFVIAINSSFERFLRYLKFLELKNK
jgi:glycosyltransferase involved in cell wall biosynthesis